MENITRTVYGNDLQTMADLKLPFKLIPNTTLNEKLNIQSGVAPAANEMPSMQFAAIGIGGHKYKTGADSIGYSEPVQHVTTDAGLYKQLPFVLRLIDSDLSAGQRANYGLRRQETHDGDAYYAYYLKRLPNTGVETTMEYRVNNNGVETISTFIPNASNLSPTPPDLSSGVNVLEGKYVAVTAKVKFTMTEEEVAEFLNVAQILFGTESLAIISEIALVSGVNKIVSVSSGASQVNFNEVIAAQINTFFNTMQELKYSNTGIELVLNLGATEPMLSLTTL